MEDRANKYSDFTLASCSNRTSLLLAMAAQKGRMLILGNLLSGDLLDSVEMNEPLRSLAWSPADELLAVGSSQRIWIFRASHEGFEKPARELPQRCSEIQAVAFSGDGRLLACRDGQGLKIWDQETLQLVGALLEKTPAASGIAFHPAEPLFATSTPDGTRLRILEF
jgi:WD40 repeat protein